MLEKWTGDLIGKMHNEKISLEELGSELGIGKGYVSMILNGKRNPKNAAERFNNAFNSIISKRNKETEVK